MSFISAKLADGSESVPNNAPLPPTHTHTVTERSGPRRPTR